MDPLERDDKAYEAQEQAAVDAEERERQEYDANADAFDREFESRMARERENPQLLRGWHPKKVGTPVPPSEHPGVARYASELHVLLQLTICDNHHIDRQAAKCSDTGRVSRIGLCEVARIVLRRIEETNELEKCKHGIEDLKEVKHNEK